MSNETALRKIVVATDFSEDAGAALDWAKELARQHHARIVLAHSLFANPLAAPESVLPPPRESEKSRRDATNRLEADAAVLRGDGISVTCELVPRYPVDGIVSVALRHGAELIVAGTRGRTGWRRALLGSTAARLVREASCPVLTVHRQDGLDPRPIRTMLVPTDFSEDATLAAETAVRILRNLGVDGRLVLLHAYHVPDEIKDLPAKVLMDAIRSGCDKAQTRLEAKAARLRLPGVTVETITREGYPPDLILEHAAAAHADVIAMGTHGRSGASRMLLGSNAESVLATASCPVLTVRLPPGD